jgi:hypothetical protein
MEGRASFPGVPEQDEPLEEGRTPPRCGGRCERKESRSAAARCRLSRHRCRSDRHTCLRSPAAASGIMNDLGRKTSSPYQTFPKSGSRTMTSFKRLPRPVGEPNGPSPGLSANGHQTGTTRCLRARPVNKNPATAGFFEAGRRGSNPRPAAWEPEPGWLVSPFRGPTSPHERYRPGGEG